MVKVWQLTRGAPRRGHAAGYDLVVLDAPATGHALGMLGSPRTFGAIARVGPIAGQTRQLRELLESPARSAYLAVALGTEMAVTESLELQEGLRARLGRDLDTVIVNALLPRRFTAAELRRILSLGRRHAGRCGRLHLAGRSGTARRCSGRAPGRDRCGRAGREGRCMSARACSTTSSRVCADAASMSSASRMCGARDLTWRR